ncbi:MAG: transaldolase [Phycisphaerae bacterium]
MSNTIQKLYEQGQSIWCDNISRPMIDSGELQHLIDLGVVGVTSNPTIFMKAISGGNDYEALFSKLLGEGREIMGIYEGLVLPDVADAADMLRPVYDRTDRVDGYVSLEVNPKLAYDTEGTIAEARRLFAELNRPNIFIKVPATNEGIPAIERLIGEGINVNVTLIFSLAMHEKVMRAYVDGLERIVASGGDPSKVASVASFFVSRIDTLADKLLTEKHPPHTDISDLLGAAAIANARLAYARFERFFDPAGEFGALANKGARVQRPVWASTSTKNPDYPATKYVDGLVGPQTVNTLPPHTIDAVLHEGGTKVTIRDDLPGAHAIVEQLEKLGIHTDAVTDKLLVDGVDLFAKSFDELLANLMEKREELRAAG